MAAVHLASDHLPDDAAVRRFSASEGLSRPYRVEVDFATADHGFALDGCLGRRALLTLVDHVGRRRCFDGLVEEARLVGHTGTHLHCRLSIVPLLAMLRRREDCRVFQDKSVVEVVKQVLADAGADERVSFRLVEAYPARDLASQYRETDLGFVERLCEDEGIFYFFEHADDGHTLVFGDHPGAFQPAPGLEPVRFGMTRGLAGVTDPLAVLAREHRVRPRDVRVRDFDFMTPQVKPEGSASAPGPWPLGVYEHGAGVTTADGRAEHKARVRLKELRRDADVCRGQSQAVGLCPGVPFEVVGASEPSCNGAFVVTLLETEGEQGPDGGAEGQNVACKNRFEAVPAGTDLAPPRRAPRPRIRGIQTAIVTGPTNEQQAIHVDRLGRVKVRFHWDRSGIGDDRSSPWLRVAQTGLGASMILPRVGWEVAVAFEHGDPDRPFVIGRLYNGKQRPLVDVKGNATVGQLRSLSTPGAAKENVLGSDDKGGSQGASLGGAKDVNTFVGNDKSETVAVDEEHSVQSNLKSSVGGSESWEIGGNQSIDVGNALQVQTGGAQTIAVGGSESVGSKANYIEAIGGARGYSIGGSRITISNGVRTLVSGAITRNVGAVQANVAAGAINEGMASTYDETVSGVKAEIVRGDSTENVAGAKLLTSSLAELHQVANLTLEAAAVSRNIGSVYMVQCGGKYEVSAPKIALCGGVGVFNGGGSTLQLMGGPVLVKGSTVTIKSALIRKLAGSLELE